jgi:hypothetical protein
VVVDLGPGVQHGGDGLFVPLEVGDQDLDRAGGNPLVHEPDRLGEDPGAKVRQVVTVYGRDNGVPEVHHRRSLSDPPWLLQIGNRGPAVGHGAVAAVPRADVPQDHERRRTMLPALTDVGAVGLLANGMEVQLPHQVLEPYIVSPAGGLHLEPRRLPFRERNRPMAPHYLVQRIRHLPVVTVVTRRFLTGAPNLDPVSEEVMAT